jgi:TP901 family phage tail tape measure protein
MADVSKIIRIDVVTNVDATKAKIDAAMRGIVSGGKAATSANDNLAGSFSKAERAMMGASGQGNALSKTFGTIEKSSSALTSKLGSLNGSLTGLAFAGAGAAALAFVGAIGAAYGAASRYQDVLAKISTNVDTATFSMAALSAGILAQSRAFGQSPAAQAEAAYDIISAGAESASAALEILTSANKLAVGGITTVGVAADGLTSVINAYGAANLTAADASDAMFISARDGKTTIDQLASSLGTVTPLAASLGVSFDEVNGAIGVLTKGGIQTTVSVTGLKAILSSIAKPSSEAAKAAKSIGLEFNVAGLRAKGLQGFLKDVAEKTGHSAAKMATLFGGVEALVPVLALTGKGAQDFANTMESMGHKAGTTEAAVKKMMDGSPSIQSGRVVSNFMVELTEMGAVLAQVAVPAMKFLADNMQNIFRVAGAAAAGLATFGAIVVGIKLVGMVQQVIGLNMALGATGPVSALFSAGMKMAQGSVNGLTASLMANPLTALATALTVAAVLLYQFRDSIMVTGDGLTSLGDFGRAAFEMIVPAITAIGEVASSVFGAVGKFFSTAFSGISTVFTSVFGDLDLSFEGVLTGAARVADGVVGFFTGCFYAVGAIWDNLPALLGPNIMAVLNFGKMVVTGIGTAISSVYNAIVGFGKSVASIFSSVFNSMATFIEKWANKAIDLVNTVIAGANKMGAGIDSLGPVTMAKIAPPTVDQKAFALAGAKVGDAFNSGFNNSAEKGVKNLFGRAKTIGANRRGSATTGTGTGAVPSAATAIDDSGFDPEDKKKKKKGDSAAKKLAEIKAKYDDLFAQMTEDVKLAGMLPVQAQLYNKELELRKILGDGNLSKARELTAEEKLSLSNLLAKARNTKFITDATETHKTKVLELDAQAELIAKRLAGFTDEQLSVEKTMLDYKNNALHNQVDITSEAYKIAEKQARLDAARGVALDKQNAQLTEALSLAKQYSAAYIKADAAKTFKEQRQALEVGFNGGNNTLGITQKVHDEVLAGINKASTDASNKMLVDFGQSITDLGQQFGGTFGKAISSVGNLLDNLVNATSRGPIGGLLNVFAKSGSSVLGKISSNANTASQNSMDQLLGRNGQTSALKNPLASLSKGFGDFKGDMKNLFGKNGDLAKGLGSVMGKAASGAQMGATADSLMKAIGIKSSKTGAQIGGALGTTLFGPIGGIIGSIGGGIIGGMFKKVKTGAVVINSATGKSKEFGKLGAELGGDASSVQSALTQISDALGGTLGDFAVSIGKRKDYFRVSANGSSDVGNKSPGSGSQIIYDGKDEAEAIKVALQNALQDGAIKGISDFSRRVLSSMDVDQATKLATGYETVLKALAAYQNPVKSAVDETLKSIDQLVDGMKKAGASTEELANVEQYRAKKLDEVLKDQLSSFKSILDNLNGDAGGFSALTQLNNNIAKMGDFKADLAAGKSIDQDAFSELANKIISGAGNVYGSTTAEYQSVIGDIRAMANSGITNATNQFNSSVKAADTTAAAITAQTQAYSSNQQVTNDYLRQMVAMMQNGNGLGGSSQAVTSTNGKMVSAA